MFIIETFTAQSDLAEDRIRLDAISSEGETQSIFLTRRLADRMVPLLVERAEQQTVPGVPKDIALAMNQEQLRIERDENPIAPIEAKQGSSRWLSQTVHVGADDDQVVWTLTDDADNTAVMGLPGDGVRNVLEVLLIVYQGLEWTTQAFPSWMTAREEAPGRSSRVLN
ncbi:MAG: hypothetical protein ABIM50_05905 [Novosphingobium sp.]